MARKTRITGKQYERLTLNQRVQHIVLMVSFSLLVLTGLPVRYPYSPISSFIINALGGYETRGIIHRAAAITLIGLTFYHLGYSAFSRRGRAELLALAPKKKDFVDLFDMLKLFFGFARSGPKFDRYNYIEKFEYFAVGWGSVVMIVTGLMLWFPAQALRFVPMWILDIARIIHSWEALLAFLTILIWHMYHAHLRPGTFPMNWVWLNGMISEEDMKHHHPLEYERLKAPTPPRPVVTPPKEKK